MRKVTILFFVSALFLGFFVSVSVTCRADDDDASRMESADRRLMEKKEKPPEIMIKEIIEAKRPTPSLPAGKVSVREINVIGVTILSKKEIDGIILPYRNKELTGAEMQKCADLITDLYNRKGYITSFAYISPEKISQGILEIMTQEGKMGEIKIKGNRYFKDSLLKGKITLKKGEPFNFSVLKRDIYRLSKHPDRKVSVELEHGEKAGFADVILVVKDRFPFHYMYQFDNYGSNYIMKKRHKSYFTYNNLTGHDDVLVNKWEYAEYTAHRIIDFDYYLPITNDLKLEVYAMPYKREYFNCELQFVDREKNAQDYKLIAIASLYDQPKGSIDASLGFGYWDILWFQQNTRVGMDKMRAILTTLELDISDRFGRTIMTNDVHFGIPNMLKGLGSKDDRAFIPGAGSKFIYEHLVFARRHKFLFNTEILFKTQYQFSTHTLIGARKFTVGGTGGVVDMRGYRRAEVIGDSGVSASNGIAFPPYFLPKNFKVPFSKANWYDALRLFIIHDWASARPRSVPEGSKVWTTLRSAGCGLEFRLPEHGFSARTDIFWPLSRTPSDADHCHIWVTCSKDFTF